jgi:hypothetical protein
VREGSNLWPVLYLALCMHLQSLPKSMCAKPMVTESTLLVPTNFYCHQTAFYFFPFFFFFLLLFILPSGRYANLFLSFHQDTTNNLAENHTGWVQIRMCSLLDTQLCVCDLKRDLFPDLQTFCFLEDTEMNHIKLATNWILICSWFWTQPSLGSHNMLGMCRVQFSRVSVIAITMNKDIPVKGILEWGMHSYFWNPDQGGVTNALDANILTGNLWVMHGW